MSFLFLCAILNDMIDQLFTTITKAKFSRKLDAWILICCWNWTVEIVQEIPFVFRGKECAGYCKKYIKTSYFVCNSLTNTGG